VARKGILDPSRGGVTLQVIPHHSGRARIYIFKRWHLILLTLIFAVITVVTAGLAVQAWKITTLSLSSAHFQNKARQLEQENFELHQALMLIDTVRMEQEQIFAVANLLRGDTALEHRSEREPSLVTDQELEQYIARYRIDKSKSKGKSPKPTIKPAIGIITQGYSEAHPGVDIAAILNDPVYAAGDGVVVEAGSDPELGNFVIIDHGEEWRSRYGHLDRILVRRGDPIKGGGSLGTVGMTGNTTGPHLHYDVFHEGAPVDPSAHFNE